MTKKTKTQAVDKTFFPNFLKKARECRSAARACLSKGDWNAAAICAVHGCISASDALCVFYLGERSCSEKHSDAAILLRMIKPGDDAFKKNTLRLTRILGLKSMAEYEERLVFRTEAEKAVQDCERFIEFAESLLPEG